MNIASWLARAGLSHPGLPAVGQGRRVTQSYGQLAERAARLAGALRALGLAPGDRVAIIAKNCVEYLETIYGIWHGGLRGGAGERQAARARARLHFGTFRRARLLRDAGTGRGGRAACAAKPGTADRDRQRSVSRAVCRRSAAGHAARRQRPRLAVLHLRHHRPAEGRDADPSRAGAGELRLSHRGGRGRAGRLDPACGADEPRLRPLHDGACRPARHQRGAGVRRLRAGRDFPPVRHLAAHLDVRRAHHGEAAHRFRRRRRPGEPAHHRVGRRADVCRGRPEGARPLRPAACADLRPGRKPDDHHDAVASGHRRPRRIRAGSNGSPRPGGPMRAST